MSLKTMACLEDLDIIFQTTGTVPTYRKFQHLANVNESWPNFLVTENDNNSPKNAERYI